jgi:hypothetical protein
MIFSGAENPENFRTDLLMIPLFLRWLSNPNCITSRRYISHPGVP